MSQAPDCGICLDPVPETSDKFSFLDNCCHKFCFQCISDWSKISTRCPLCKVHFSLITQRGGPDGKAKCTKVSRKELKIIDEGLPDYYSDESDSFVCDDDDIAYSSGEDVGSWEYAERIQSQKKRKRYDENNDTDSNKRIRLQPPDSPRTPLQENRPKPERPAFKSSISQPLHTMARTHVVKPSEMRRTQSLLEMAKLRQQVEQSRRQLQVINGKNSNNTNNNNSRHVQSRSTSNVTFNNVHKNLPREVIDDPVNESVEKSSDSLEPRAKLTSSDLFRNTRFDTNTNSMSNNIKAAISTANSNTNTNPNAKVLSSVLSAVRPAPAKKNFLGVQSTNLLLQSAQSSLERFQRNSQESSGSSSPSPRESRRGATDKENKQPTRHFDNVQNVPMDYTTKQFCFHASVYIKSLLQPHFNNGTIDKERFKAIVEASLEEFKAHLLRAPNKKQPNEVTIEPFKTELQHIVARLMPS